MNATRPELNVLMVGVGGQGTVMASDILAEAALLEGFDVKKSDALGMSQRGGSVVSHVRLGPQVFSPLVKKGEADILLGFEKLESARWAGHLRPGGLAIINDQAVPPFSVSSGSEKYPSDETVLELLRQRTSHVFVVPGLALAREAGNPRALNAVMLGFLSLFLGAAGSDADRYLALDTARSGEAGLAPGSEVGVAPASSEACLATTGRGVISQDAWLKCLGKALPPNLLDVNIIAFEKGRQAADAAIGGRRSAVSHQQERECR